MTSEQPIFEISLNRQQFDEVLGFLVNENINICKKELTLEVYLSRLGTSFTFVEAAVRRGITRKR